jgi:hypothetical protein
MLLLTLINRFAVQAKSIPSTIPMLPLIPALVTVRADGRIVSVSKGFADLVRHVRLYDLVPDSAIRRADSTAVQAEGK